MGIVKNSLYRVASGAWLRFFKNEPVFGYYHLVRNNKVPHIEHLYAYKNVAQFVADVDFLKANYRATTPAELRDGRAGKNVFLLSFDDGLEEIYSVVFPILKAKNLRAVFFINPNFVDNAESLYKHDISVIIGHLKAQGFNAANMAIVKEILPITFQSNEEFAAKFKQLKFADRDKVKEIAVALGIDMRSYLKQHTPYISKAQIKEMLDAGFWFGGHTMSHPPLGQLSHAAQKAEIQQSVQWLKDHFHIDYSLFAFPFTDKNISRRLIDELLAEDDRLLIFGNSGLRQDVHPRIIQRFSLENPTRETPKVIVAEHLYKIFNKLIGKYHIRRK
ncbi:NodB-like y domain-containing protein [Flavobacterium longum]|uniref:polysaccharide deacetylase family protein n=1 Tax=Flavobacterium longum TaxID=1299340 RepID=UPI0039EA71EB